MLKRIFCVFIAMILVLLCACSSAPKPLAAVAFPKGISLNDYDARRELIENYPIEEEFSKMLADFSVRTTVNLYGECNGNFNYSPVSLYLAMALCANGAEGETKAQILSLLGANDEAYLVKQCEHFYRRNYTDNSIGKLKIANSVWMNNGQGDFSCKDEFLKTAAESFFAEIFSADFTKEKTAEQMSKWVQKNTKGTIAPNINLGAEALMTIFNTVYFCDQWTDRFDTAKTEPDIFSGDDGAFVIDFMNAEFSSHSFVRGENFTRSGLGLKNSGSMIFVLPDEGVSISELMTDEQTLENVLFGGESKAGRVTFKIPKFSFSAVLELKAMLNSLGVADAFSWENADFSAASDSEMCLSDVTQQTHIALDEKGVVASSFTELMYAGAAMPEGSADMCLDRPFIYAVLSSTNDVLFIGVFSCEK